MALGAIAGIITSLLSGAAAVGAGEHFAGRKREEAAADAERKKAETEAEADSNANNWQRLEGMRGQYEKAGVSPNVYSRMLDRAKIGAAQLYHQNPEQASAAGISAPPEYFAALAKSQQPQAGAMQPTAVPTTPSNQAAGDYLATASSPEVQAQRNYTGLPPISPETNDFRARAFTGGPPAQSAIPPSPARGQATGRRTDEGRQILSLPDGSIETEKTITVTDPRINNGRPTNIPTIYNGRHVDEEQAVDIVARSGGVDPDTGRRLEGFNSIPDAERAAQARSQSLGKYSQQGLTFPKDRSQLSTSMTGFKGTATSTIKALDGPEATADLISQARSQNLPASQIQGTFDAGNAERRLQGKPELELDHQQLQAYKDEQFDKLQSDMQTELEARGVPKGQAYVQSAMIAKERTGYVPTRWMDVIKPKEGDLANGAAMQAIQAANDSLPKILAMVGEAKTPAAAQGAIPPGFLSRAIDATPGIKPQDAQTAKHTLAMALATRLRPLLTQQFPGRTSQQISAKAMQLASYGVDGDVPREWHQIVLENPTEFGFSNEQAAVMAQNHIDPFAPDAGVRARDAMTQNAITQNVVQQGVAKPTELQSTVQAGEALRGKVTPQQATADAQAAQLKQQEQKKTQDKEIDYKFGMAPDTEVKRVTALDDIYTTSLSVMQQLQAKDATGRTVLQKYGDQPSFVFGPLNDIKKKFGSVPPEIAKLRATVGKLYNFEKHEITGAATSVGERKDLTTFMSTPSDNLYTMLQNYTQLASITGGELERDTGMIAKNYPKTDLSSLGHSKIKAERERRAKEKK